VETLWKRGILDVAVRVLKKEAGRWGKRCHFFCGCLSREISLLEALIKENWASLKGVKVA